MVYQFKKFKKTEILKNHLHMGGCNSQGERIDVTSLYFTRNEKPWIGVMGEFHFSRCESKDWYQELCKMKAGGITIVATYLFWIYHEEEEGRFDFTGNLDVRKFILEAKRAGLDVVIRIGPWAHGECRNGGFPDWLLEKPFKLRDNNSEYMAKARIWYEKIYEQVKGLFYKDGGNIIAIQFENELTDNAEHILALKQLALEIGYETPLYTATGWNSKYGAKIPVDDVVPVFAAYADAPWDESLEQLPLSPHYVFDPTRNDAAVGMDIMGETDDDGWRLPYERYPFATCEIGSGLQVTHQRRPLVSGMDAYALSLVKLGCGNNLVGYYMYHGGTNLIGKLSTFNETKVSGYPNDYPILNYDFHTALSEYGEAREQHGLLNLLHLFVNDFGESLATMEYVPSENVVKANDLNSLRYCMRTDGDAGFVFINHYQRLAKLTDVNGVVIDTGNVQFPSINVCGETSFFLPFNMNLGGNALEYATAQPLCEFENTYFFVAIEGIKPEYKFKDGNPSEITIVTLDFEQAKYARKLNGKIYIGHNCNLYEKDGRIEAIEPGSFQYSVWGNDKFEDRYEERKFHQATVTYKEIAEPFLPPYLEELNLECERKRTWKKITVTRDEGFIEITDSYDAAQIYADEKLVADNFYAGENWRVPAHLLYEKECYLVMSEMKDDFYKEL